MVFAQVRHLRQSLADLDGSLVAVQSLASIPMHGFSASAATMQPWAIPLAYLLWHTLHV